VTIHACYLCAIALVTVAATEAAATEQRLWKPVADEVYLQEVGQKLKTDKPVTAVAVSKGEVYAVVGGRLCVVRAGALEDVANAPKSLSLLRAMKDALWCVAESGTYRLADGKWTRVTETRFVDLCMHGGSLYGATRDAVFRWDGTTGPGAFVDIKPEGGYLSTDSTVIMEDGSQVLADPVLIGPIQRIASYSGTLYLLQPGRLALISGKTFVPEPVDWGQLVSENTRDLLVQGSRLYVATDRGLAVLRGMALTALRGTDGLPYEDATCLAAGFDDDLWIGTTRGAIRQVGDEYHYFGAHHWLPGDNVRDIAVGDRVVYIATDAGIGVVRYEPYTLLKKAAYFERHLEEWGHKRLGFIHSLYWSGDKDGWLREISDNDGGHTAHHLAAMSFKYAATGDEKARQEAVDAFQAMVWLDEITPKPGFIARAIWSVKGDKGHRSERGSGGLPAKWYPTPDGLWLWKGDTSSDEVDAHFYAVSIFHDLAAQGAEKDRAKQHIARMASHIMDNGWVLRDMDGKPTRWGRWDPEYLLRPYGHESRGLNGMEAQSFMRTAFALTGDAKYEQGFQQLLKWGYHTYTVRQKLTFPPEGVVPWDDELAFRAYYPLLRYTQDPEMRSIYLRSIERHWEVMRMQHVPFFNFIYGGLTGNDCEAERAVKHLREWSLDLVGHNYRNSHRCDLGPEPGYVPYQGGTRAMSPRETQAMCGSRSALRYDGGHSSRSVTAPIGWLEDYWMGRYFGLIKAPTTTDAKLISLEQRPPIRQGAAPYDGPPRPMGIITGQR
jgi:hypothetical protein